MDLEVLLRFPPKIIAGLLSGELQLWGGVVRNAANGQIVALLREGEKIASNSDLASGVLKTVLDASSGGMFSMAAELADTAVTARSHFLIMQQLEGLTNLVGLVGGVGVLNLATTVVSTGIILKRLNDLEQAIRDLDITVAKQFALDRQAKVDAAMQAAEDALSMECPSNRKSRADSALDKLFEARQHIWLEIDTLKGSSHYRANNDLMQKNILQGMQLDWLRSRCLLELGEVRRAKSYLDSNFNDYRETTRSLVHRHLGTHRAAYFHNSVRESDMLRYIAIEHWLRPDENRLLEILIANRRDFWNKEVADEKNIKKPGKDQYIDALTQSELLIENYRRYKGFHAETEAIERLGVKHSDWEKQQEEALAKAEINLAEHDDYVLLVDKEWLAEQSDTTAA